MASWHILGPGSIGLLVAYNLRRANIPVTLLVRDARRADRFTAGDSLITLERNFNGQHQVQRVTSRVELITPPPSSRTPHVRISPLHSSGPASAPEIHQLVVATKSTDVTRAVKSVQHRLTPDSTILLLQNGILAVYTELWRDVLQHMESPPHVIIGSMTHGCYMHQPFHVFHAGLGALTLASVDSTLPDLTDPGHRYKWQAPHDSTLQQLLQLEGLQPRLLTSHSQFMQQLLIKLAVNCCINPLTALLGCHNGYLIANQHTRDMMRQICDELHTVFGPQLSESSYQLYNAVYQVAESTARNKSSMLQDIVNGRPTEVEYLSGYVIRQAAQQGVEVAVNTSMYRMVKTREALAEQVPRSASQSSVE